MEKTFAKSPEGAITEFAWKGAMPPPQTMSEAGIYGVTCDPCPPPHPVDNPLTRLLGADVLPGLEAVTGSAGLRRCSSAGAAPEG